MKNQQQLSPASLLESIRESFKQILRENPYESSLNQEEIRQRLKFKSELRNALKNCVFGDGKAKVYVKDYIKDILLRRFCLNKDTINEVIPFDSEKLLTAQDKFEILLYNYRRDYDELALEMMVETHQLAEGKRDGNNNLYYEIGSNDINRAYEDCPIRYLPFHDRLNILAQRIYQSYKGNGVIDEIRDMKIDGVSGGVSGIPSWDSIWIFYKGRSIRLSFLSFQSEKELVRVCKNIYRFDNPGQLTEVKGYIVNEMRDGSRVAVARPPFSESWLFFVRKFDRVLQDNIRNLITDIGNEIPIEIMKWLVKGCQVTGITGEQGSGKTTLLMALIGFIPPSYNLRIQELSFELHLRAIYPERNIVTFRETTDITGQEGLDFQKKTDYAPTMPVNWAFQTPYYYL